MNIFAVYPDPQLCAIFLDDKRVRKMLQESVDMLCTTLPRDHPHAKPDYYRHHPAVHWVKADYQHTRWLFLHASFLSFECEYRFGQTEYVHQLILEEIAPLFWLPAGPPDRFYEGASHKSLHLDFNRTEKTLHHGYRKYLRTRWPNDYYQPHWTNRAPQEHEPWTPKPRTRRN